jgi:glycine dehydrogenase subunit 2
MDIAKGLIENGFHPPTVYFPLVVKGAILVEPTETESRKTMDQFVECMVDLSRSDSSLLREFPTKSYVGRVDEVRAARKPIIRWEE